MIAEQLEQPGVVFTVVMIALPECRRLRIPVK
jgi:hypothetical protein